MHPTVDETLLTPQVLEAAAQLREDVPEAARPPWQDAWPALFAVCPYLLGTCRRYPDQVQDLLTRGELDEPWQPPSAATWQARLLAIHDGLDDTDDERRQLIALRRFRHRQMVRILVRDLLGHATVDQTLEDLTSLADVCIAQAADWAHAALAVRYGEARDGQGRAQRLIVLGMGKLGGRELNVSSDIDLIFAYAHSGETDGARKTDNADYFRRVAQRLVKLLHTTTEDGFVFRVDTRLRPFGDSGPLVMNFDGFEHYYLTQGRDWERYAMIKARAVAGDAGHIRELTQLLQPFVYRRYLDYNAIDSLRELKRKISLSVKQRGMQNNIKLGAGGIREVEFLGQVFQLVRGGRETRLQIRPIKQVLGVLGELGLMQPQDVAALQAAYDYLRRVENAVQMMRDQQVHSVPDAADDRLRLLAMLGEPDWTAFETALAAHQRVVSRHFDALFEDADSEEAGDIDEAAYGAWALISEPGAGDAETLLALESLGIPAGEELVGILGNLTRGAWYQRLAAESQERIDRVLPALFAEVRQCENTAAVLQRALGWVRAVAGRSGYLQILIERPTALVRLVSLFSQSLWLADFMTRHPVVVDELLVASRQPADGPESIMRDALALAERLAEADLEEQMDAMRQFKQQREMRIAIAELEGVLPLMKVSDHLTWLAEAIVAAVLRLVEAPLRARHGTPMCSVEGVPRATAVGVVAYGKLGGLELGYGSDLDLVFLHDSEGERQETDGDKCIDNARYYARLAQKFVHFMSTLSPAGVLYEIDLRLRPNGQSGVLVTSIAAFARYQENEAWTWEHQALVRARMIVGDPALRQRFADVRQSVLSRVRDRDTLRTEVREMRQKMRDHLGDTSADNMDLKQDAGGIADIEFLVQFLVLGSACEHAELIDWTDNVRILEAARASLLLSDADASLLTDSYLALRARVHRQQLQQAGAVVPRDDELDAIATGVQQLWAQTMQEPGGNSAANHVS